MDVNTPSKEMLFTTVRIEVELPGGAARYGTGFIYNASEVDGVAIPVLITNEHVIEGAECVTLNFIASDSSRARPAKSWAKDANN
jgi:S1-C subfamily serine protease